MSISPEAPTTAGPAAADTWTVICSVTFSTAPASLAPGSRSPGPTPGSRKLTAFAQDHGRLEPRTGPCLTGESLVHIWGAGPHPFE
jgi:hypothetical protein